MHVSLLVPVFGAVYVSLPVPVPVPVPVAVSLSGPLHVATPAVAVAVAVHAYRLSPQRFSPTSWKTWWRRRSLDQQPSTGQLRTPTRQKM